MEAGEQWLFATDDGALPPLLAGREREQALLNRCLSQLAAGKSPPHNVVLIGPRGNGKTALLNWFEGVCGRASVTVARVAPSRAVTPQAHRDPMPPMTPMRRHHRRGRRRFCRAI